MVISRVRPHVVKTSKFVVQKMGPPMRKSSRLLMNAAKPHVQRQVIKLRRKKLRKISAMVLMGLLVSSHNA